MKHIFFLFLVLAFSKVFSQKEHKVVEQLLFSADDHFDRRDYHAAATEYEAIAHFDPDNVYPAFKLAESYRHFFEYELAEQWYKKTFDLDKEGKYKLVPYWYANMLKMNGKYVEAEKAFELFLSTFQPTTKDEEIYLEYALLDYNGCVLAIDELSKPRNDFNFINLGKEVNTSHLEFAPALFGSDSIIVITSSREGSKGEEEFKMFGESYCDNYRFEYDSKHGGWKEIHNSKEHFDVVNTVRNDGSGVLNTKGDKFYYTICDENTGGECAIYVAKFDGHRWHLPEKLNENINPEGVWNAQPALTYSGDTMFFVSKRDSGYGEHDIWYSIKEKGSDDKWGIAKNMGDQVNTPYIDMCPDYHKPTNSLFFSSNGHEGFGGLDIFQAKKIFSGVRNLGLPFNSNRDDFYFVMGENKGYLASNRDDEGSQGHDDIYWFNYRSHETVLARLERDTSYRTIDITGTLLTAEDRQPISDVEVMLTSDGEILLRTKTDEFGKFKFNTLEATKDYLLKLEAGNPNLTDDIKYILDQLEVKKSQTPVSRTLFENIYFDFDKSLIRPEAKKTLDLLVDFQKSHPDIQIELKGNTDSKGSDEYNEKLSQRRGSAAYDYLRSKGFPNSSLVVSGNGEGSPIASNINEIGRQLNRRVEFYVRGSNTPDSPFMTYIVEKQKGLNQIAEMFGMTVAELKEANNLTSDNIKLFAPLRVKKSSPNDMIASTSRLASDMKEYENIVADNYVDPKAPKDIILIMKNSKDGESFEGIVINQLKVYENNAYNLIQINNDKVVAQKGEEIYIVKPLDVLAKIAKEYNMTVDELKELNDLSTNRIQIGQRLRVKKVSK